MSNSKWYRLAAVTFWLAAWQLASQLIAQDLLLVSPINVLGTLASLVFEAGFWTAIGFSSLRIIGGLLLGMIAGVVLAAASGRSKRLRILLEPLFSAMKSVPVASFVILVLIWSGSRNLSVVISLLMVLPVIYMGVLEGILQRDPGLQEMAKVFGIPRIRRLRAIDVPAVMPYFSASSKVALGLCWKSGIAAEVIGLPSGSIGEKLYQAKIFLGTSELFGWTIVIVLISWLFEKIFLRALDRYGRHLIRKEEGL